MTTDHIEAWTLQDLIGLLPKRVLHPGDFIRCAAVCQVWKLSFAEYKPQSEPWLMCAERKDSDVRDFYNISNGNTLSFDLPEVYGRWFYALNNGWLFTLGLDMAISLLHPLTRIQIPLPSANMFTDTKMLTDKEHARSVFINSVCLSSDPSKKDCVVMVTYGSVRNVAFARLGDSCWTDVELPTPCFRDFMFFEGKFYALKRSGLLVVCDVDLSQPKARTVLDMIPPRPNNYSWVPDSVYLLELDRNILVVVRYLYYKWGNILRDETDDEILGIEIINYHTTSFEVYKLETKEKGEMEWSSVTDLGDYALFLGRNSSMSICIKNNDALEKNCIYFTDDSLQKYVRRWI